MSDLAILFDDHGLSRALSGAALQRLPRSTAATLNRIAYSVTGDLKAAERNQLHLTRAFITSQTQYEAARSAQGAYMQSQSGITDKVYFAERLVEGGTRSPFRSEYIAVPVEAKRNRRGGITASQRPSAILSRRGFFLATIHGTHGIYKRVGANVQLMYVLKKTTDYDEPPYLDFEGVVNGNAEMHNFPAMLEADILRALGLS